MLALLAGLIPLMGCSDRGADSRKVAEAARRLGEVGSADLAGDSGSYATVTTAINGVDVSGEAAQAVKSGLLAQSLQGEASVAFNEASRQERALLSRMQEVMRLSRLYESHRTTATTLEAFDPTADLERISGEVEGLERATREARNARAAVSEQIADLESRAETLRTQSAEKRDRAAEMKLESAGLSATEAASQAGTIRTLTREADGLDLNTRRLEGETETLRPRLTELEAEISKLEQQRELMLEAAEELRQMATDRRAEAARAASRASEIAEQIRTEVNAIDDERSAEAIPAAEAAAEALERAVRESDSAARQVRSFGTLSKSAAKRRLAELLHSRAHGHERYAETLESLASIEGMPNGSAYAEAARSERSEASELRAEAAQAYEDAASSLTSVNIRGTDSERAEETAQRLRSLATTLRGADETPEPGAAP